MFKRRSFIRYAPASYRSGNGAEAPWSNCARFDFDSWIDFVDRAESGETDMPLVSRGSREQGGFHSSDWSGTDSFEDAIRLARNGWPEGTNRIKSKLEVFYDKLPRKSIRRDFCMSMVGPGTLDMQRYFEGHPEPWIAHRETEDIIDPSEKIVRIGYNVCASAAIRAEEIINKGIMICSLIDMLERTGFRVELTLFSSTTGWKWQNIISAVIKRANDAVDVDRIAFSIAHPSCLRRLVLSVMEQCSPEQRQDIGIPGGYGLPADNVGFDGEVYIPVARSDDTDYTGKGMTRWLKDKLEKFGVELKED